MADIEDRVFARRFADVTVDRPVFITSLPRAGTTLEALADGSVMLERVFGCAKVGYTLQHDRNGWLLPVEDRSSDAIADDLRFALKACVGEENFIDMQPNRSNNYCCGGGGGFLQSGYKEERLAYGKLKDDQIKATGADYCIAGCHNCHAQIHELSEHYGGNYPVVHLWTLICLSLGILGPNEREYLGDDLKELNVFHPETAM